MGGSVRQVVALEHEAQRGSCLGMIRRGGRYTTVGILQKRGAGACGRKREALLCAFVLPEI